jgi:hypothetical protein
MCLHCAALTPRVQLSLERIDEELKKVRVVPALVALRVARLLLTRDDCRPVRPSASASAFAVGLMTSKIGFFDAALHLVHHASPHLQVQERSARAFRKSGSAGAMGHVFLQFSAPRRLLATAIAQSCNCSSSLPPRTRKSSFCASTLIPK